MYWSDERLVPKLNGPAVFKVNLFYSNTVSDEKRTVLSLVLFVTLIRQTKVNVTETDAENLQPAARLYFTSPTRLYDPPEHIQLLEPAGRQGGSTGHWEDLRPDDLVSIVTKDLVLVLWLI